MGSGLRKGPFLGRQASHRQRSTLSHPRPRSREFPSASEGSSRFGGFLALVALTGRTQGVPSQKGGSASRSDATPKEHAGLEPPSCRVAPLSPEVMPASPTVSIQRLGSRLPPPCSSSTDVTPRGHVYAGRPWSDAIGVHRRAPELRRCLPRPLSEAERARAFRPRERKRSRLGPALRGCTALYRPGCGCVRGI